MDDLRIQAYQDSKALTVAWETYLKQAYVWHRNKDNKEALDKARKELWEAHRTYRNRMRYVREYKML